MLTVQEGDSHFAIFESAAAEPDAAEAEAWALYRPTPPPPLKLPTDLPAKYGITSIGHGGGLYGYRSQMRWLPDHGVGIVLSNANTGDHLLRVVYRFLLELLFDGQPEAIADLRNVARTIRESVANERPRLAVPTDGQAVAALAAHYEHPSLGAIDVRRAGAATRFDFGEWASDVATRTNADGTVSFVVISPGIGGLHFVVGSAGGRRTSTLREAQSEYVFVEVPRLAP